MFLTCNVWRQAAENVAETLTKGMRVIVNGRLRQRSYQNRDGETALSLRLRLTKSARPCATLPHRSPASPLMAVTAVAITAAASSRIRAATTLAAATRVALVGTRALRSSRSSQLLQTIRGTPHPKLEASAVQTLSHRSKTVPRNY